MLRVRTSRLADSCSGQAGVVDYYNRGRGSLKLRSKVATEDLGRDREALIVTELPYQVNKARLIADIAAMANEKRIEGISDIRDESDRDGMRIVIELKRGETRRSRSEQSV